MTAKPSALTDWTPDEVAQAQLWVETWKAAGPELEKIRRKEIRELDTYRTIQLLCADVDYTSPPRAPKPWSGLVEQQRLFMKAHK